MFWSKADQETTTDIGFKAEFLAKKHLESQGLIFKHANFRSKVGEIDIIMLDGNTLTFIEVKYRKSSDFGGGISAITPIKISKIKKCAQFYLQQNGLNEYNTACRFDVVTLDGSLTKPEIHWHKNAF